MTLNTGIAQTIAAATPYLERMPGVVIIHQLHPFKVLYMSESGLQELGVSLQELQDMGPEYHEQFFNPEDVRDYAPKVLGMVERNNNKETVSHFQQVRGRGKEEWKWHVTGTRIFMQDDEGKPVLTISVAIPVDAQHYFTQKIERLLEENEFLRRNKEVFAGLTKREKQILCMMAKNASSADIGKVLFLSEDTVKTHRRNIKKKTGMQTQYDIVRFAQAFNII